ncbi:MAG: hypothetical protein IPM79_36225 [Polyangiaceae bacterium]|nr:hypothetical protein [Polyangiaceae bacterium]MBK8942902.1 hypothetical protein [Polyangiaceae bacterium]
MVNAKDVAMGAAAMPGAAQPMPAGLYTIELAAVILDTTPVALRARCRRKAKREGREVVARLGAGVVGYKFRGNWRVRFLPA